MSVKYKCWYNYTLCSPPVTFPLSPRQLGGTALLGVGIWVSVDRMSFLKVLGPFSSQATQFSNVSFFCIALGAVLILLGFLGCCGAQRNSKCLMLAFFVILLLIFIAEVGVGIMALAYSSLTESILRAWAIPALKGQYGSDPAVTEIWNITMTELKCCGFTNYTDFTDSLYYTQNGKTYPPTCCTDNTLDCSLNDAANSTVKGCFYQLLSILENNAGLIGGIAAVNSHLSQFIIICSQVYNDI
uniref:Tetraspanin n=1 Tax=Scleropages formosus TaxID=113540 RepID=A0A8C9TXV4_SCLFO